MATVDGVVTAPNAHGVVDGNATPSKLAGTGANDSLRGMAGNDIYYGGAGNDSFILSAKALANAASNLTSGINGVAVIYDFGGAGGWSASNNDFIALTGFGAGSTITFSHYGTSTNYQFYTISDTATGNDYQIYVNSLSGKLLGAGDFNFY